MSSAKKPPQKRYRLRISLFLLSILLLFAFLDVLTQAVETLHELTRVEAERDQWQRPDEILREMNLSAGSVAVDLGSGAGYFALKLSKAVGDRGRVLAVDLRKLSLAFLWVRSMLQPPHNVHVIVGELENPRLTANNSDSVLIANTYHEFADPKPILDDIFVALRPGGRLVIVDRGPVISGVERGGQTTDSHEIPISRVERAISAAGFRVVRMDDNFIDRPGDHWWLLVGEKNP